MLTRAIQVFGGLQRTLNPLAFSARAFSATDDVPEAKILTGDQTFDDSEFQNWVTQGSSSKQIQYRLPKRNPFFKVGFNENHISNQGKYPRLRKERLAQWDNPSFDWPPRMPRPTMHYGQTLLNHIDSEEKKKIEDSRQFKMPDYRSGDVLEVTMFTSLSEGKFNTFRGVVYSKKQPNNLRQAFKLHTVIDDVNTSYMIKTFSPMVAKVDVVNYGSNKNRKKLNYIPDLQLSKNRLLEPIIKGKGYKHRDQMYGSSRSASKEKKTVDPLQIRGKAKRESVKLDTQKY